MNKEKAYLIGVCLGDATLSIRRSGKYLKYELSLEVIDKEFVEKFQKCLETVYGTRYNISKRTQKKVFKDSLYVRDFYRCQCQKQDVVNDLVNEINNLNPSRDELIEITKGMWDSDGFISMKRQTVFGYGKSNDIFIQFLKRLRIGIAHYIEHRANGLIRINIKNKEFAKLVDMWGGHLTIKRKDEVYQTWKKTKMEWRTRKRK